MPNGSTRRGCTMKSYNEKKRICLGAGVVNYPMPVALIGTEKDGTANFMTAAWISMVSHTPPRLAITLGHHLTSINIKATGVFSVCFPSSGDMNDADYCGIVSGSKADKSNVFELFTGETGAPMIERFGLNIECRLDHIDANGMNETFVGDIVNIYADEAILSGGKVELSKLDPLLLSQLDRKYYTVGAVAGEAWGAGKERL